MKYSYYKTHNYNKCKCGTCEKCLVFMCIYHVSKVGLPVELMTRIFDYKIEQELIDEKRDRRIYDEEEKRLRREIDRMRNKEHRRINRINQKTYF